MQSNLYLIYLRYKRHQLVPSRNFLKNFALFLAPATFEKKSKKSDLSQVVGVGIGIGVGVVGVAAA